MIDLNDACFHLPTHPGHRLYLRFAFQGSLSMAPRMFTSRMKAPLWLHSLGDWFICAPCGLTPSKVLASVKAVRLAVNQQRSILGPTQRIAFISMALDSLAMQARLTMERMERILSLLL